MAEVDKLVFMVLFEIVVVLLAHPKSTTRRKNAMIWLERMAHSFPAFSHV
jgi:hypothetical protein